LKVFFRQTDACVVSAALFDTACEMNPQMRKDLQVLATSPDLVPVVFFFRADYPTDSRVELETAILGLDNTTAGKQVLTVFQHEKMARATVACLEPTRQLMDAFNRLPRPSSSTSAQ